MYNLEKINKIKSGRNSGSGSRYRKFSDQSRFGVLKNALNPSYTDWNLSTRHLWYFISKSDYFTLRDQFIVVKKRSEQKFKFGVLKIQKSNPQFRFFRMLFFYLLSSKTLFLPLWFLAMIWHEPSPVEPQLPLYLEMGHHLKEFLLSWYFYWKLYRRILLDFKARKLLQPVVVGLNAFGGARVVVRAFLPSSFGRFTSGLSWLKRTIKVRRSDEARECTDWVIFIK